MLPSSNSPTIHSNPGHIKHELITNLSKIDFSQNGTATKINQNVGKAKRQLIDSHILQACPAPADGLNDWDLEVSLSAIEDPASTTDMAALQIDMTLKSSSTAAADVLCDGCYVWMYTSLASTSDPNSYETASCLVEYNYATSQTALTQA